MNKKPRIEFTLITFYYDLPQFYMLCLSIKKYHNKDYKIRIVYNYDTEKALIAVDDFLKIIEDHLSEIDIEFTIKPPEINGIGWDSQQLLKWHLAYTSNAEWQVVLDSKNFYIKSFTLLDTLDFKEIPGFAFPKGDDGEWIQQELDRSFKFLESYQPEYPQKYSAMTPWIWNTTKIKEMLDTVWPNNTWKDLKKLPGTEWFLYLAWIGNDIKYHPKQIVTGIWGDGIFNASLVNGIHNKNTCFWTHHRFVTSNESLELTKQVITYSDIATDKEIAQWQYYLETTI